IDVLTNRLLSGDLERRVHLYRVPRLTRQTFEGVILSVIGVDDVQALTVMTQDSPDGTVAGCNHFGGPPAAHKVGARGPNQRLPPQVRLRARPVAQYGIHRWCDTRRNHERGH